SSTDAAGNVEEPKQACQNLDDFVAEVFDDVLTGSPVTTVAQAEQLLAANQIATLLGCIPADSKAPAADQGLLELLGTIDGTGLADAVTGELEGSVRDVGTQVVDDDQTGACRSLASISEKIADHGSNGRLPAAQAATLGGAVAGVQGLLGC